jgi:DNA-binding protein H-NS
MAKTNGLDSMPYAQLLQLQERIKAAIATRRAEDAKTAKEQLRELAEKRGFNIDELFGKRGRRGPSVVKYRNPKDSAQTWTGRGRKPNWLVDALKKGAKIDSFAI